MPPASFFHAENALKSLAAAVGASPQTPLGELTAYRQTDRLENPTHADRHSQRGS